MSEPVPIALKASALHRRFPDYDALRRRARARMPTFAYDYVDTGVGMEQGVKRNATALDALDMVPRFGATSRSPATAIELFGRRYALPVGIAPMGLMSLAWPGAETYLARAAQDAGIPFVLATGAAMSIEQAAALAPDVFWFQLYHFTGGDTDIDLDLVRRAEVAGAHVLVLTIDSAARPKRHRDLRNGLVPPFRLTPRMALQAACAPVWLAALMRHGAPRFDNVRSYVGDKADAWATAAFMVEHASGVFSWDEVARIRERWPRALVVKGLLHPADAEKAVALGADGVWLSNHGGRMFDPAPATIDLLPTVAAAVGRRAAVLFDSGVRGGHDVVRARALGADAVFAGRTFLFATAALGQAGGRHMIEIFADEIRNTLSFLGVAHIDGIDASVIWRQ